MLLSTIKLRRLHCSVVTTIAIANCCCDGSDGMLKLLKLHLPVTERLTADARVRAELHGKHGLILPDERSLASAVILACCAYNLLLHITELRRLLTAPPI